MKKAKIIPLPVPVKISPQAMKTAMEIRILFKPVPTEIDAETKTIALLIRQHDRKSVKALRSLTDLVPDRIEGINGETEIAIPTKLKTVTDARAVLAEHEGEK